MDLLELTVGIIATSLFFSVAENSQDDTFIKLYSSNKICMAWGTDVLFEKKKMTTDNVCKALNSLKCNWISQKEDGNCVDNLKAKVFCDLNYWSLKFLRLI